MTKLTDQMHTEIITTLIDGASYRESIDIQRLFDEGYKSACILSEAHNELL
ncbi:hypothetical protein ACPV4B_21190 [Vibrio parahaemolyticus]|uniref:hypothetical protein n=1 Tax=Vibrio mediterranei TaxID=689 RepID=UPI0040676EB6